MPQSKPIAVVDIGSNSVRMVVYDGLKRAPMPLFNEKVLCGLAKNMEKTGLLNKGGVFRADNAIRRFIKLSQVMKVKSLSLFATSAVRDAKDGKAFVDNIKKKYGVDIEVLSGDEEAIYAGMGIISSVSQAEGVVGDLGGGSLELIEVNEKSVNQGKSFPIGPLRVSQTKRDKEFIDSHIENYPWEETLCGKSFYAVGGAFRNLAKVHMGRKNYPLKVIHNYSVCAQEFLDTIQIISRMSESSLLKLPGISKKRASFLPYAALILERILEKGRPKKVVFTATGVREGLLFSKLANDDKLKDPLISGCGEIMSRILRSSEYGYELSGWMAPLFGECSDSEKRLRLAACIISEISCYENTEYRAELAYRRVLDSSLTGVNHYERVFIAKSLYCRYSIYPDEHILSTMQSLLSSKAIQDAQIIGTAMRLARSLSCSHSGVLGGTVLKVSKSKLTLKIEKKHRDLDGESVQKRIGQLADIMGLKPALEV